MVIMRCVAVGTMHKEMKVLKDPCGEADRTTVTFLSAVDSAV